MIFFYVIFNFSREKNLKFNCSIKADQLSESMTTPLMTTFPNSNSTRNQVDEEPLGGCYLQIVIIIYLFIIRRRWCRASTSKQTTQFPFHSTKNKKLENGEDIEQGSSSAVVLNQSKKN